MHAQPTARATPGPDPRWLPVALWLVAWLVYGLYFQAQWVYGERPIYHVTGDEPHYLVIATSLLRDGDLDVLNNYRDKDYWSFYPYHLGDPRDPEDMHALYGRAGHLYSKHSLGLPLLILPAMAVARVAGADGHGPATVLLMGITAVLSVQLFLLARRCSGSLPASLAAWAAVAFSPPLLLYADQFYPEVPGALMLVVALRGLVAPRFGRAQALTAGLALGALPWFHLRYLPLAAVAGAALAWRASRRPRSRRPWPEGQLLAWLLLPAVLCAGALLALDWRLFGGVPRVDEYGTVAASNLLVGLPGLLLDQQYGLLTYAPVLALALLGLPLLWRTTPRIVGLTLLMTLGSYFLFIASFSFWYGAFSPPARMLVPVAPLLAVPLALALARWRGTAFRLIFADLLVLTWSIAHLLVDVPRLRYNTWGGRSQMLDYLSAVWHRDLVPLLPSFVVPGPASYAWAAGAVVLYAAAAYLLYRRPSRARAAGGALALPGSGLVAGAVPPTAPL